MGIFGFVLSGGGAAGVLLGGVLTDLLAGTGSSWSTSRSASRSTCCRCASCPSTPAPAAGGRIDAAGAVTVTGALVLAVYAIVNGNEAGWGSAETLGLLGAAAVLLAAFLIIESRDAVAARAARPFRIRSVAAANAVGVLMAGGMFAWFFFSALYLQQILGYSPLEVGLVYLPSMVIWGGASLLSDKVVMRFGILPPLVGGPRPDGHRAAAVRPHPGGRQHPARRPPGHARHRPRRGIAFNPILLAAMSGVGPTEFGLASGVVNTSFMMGGAVGLAIMASVAASRTDSLESAGDSADVALNGGYHAAFLVGALFVVAAIGIGLALLRGATMAAPEGHGAPEGAPAGDPAAVDG